MPKFEFENDASFVKFQIEIAGLPAGTDTTMKVSALTVTGSVLDAEVPLVVAKVNPIVPENLVVRAVDERVISGSDIGDLNAVLAQKPEEAETVKEVPPYLKRESAGTGQAE